MTKVLKTLAAFLSVILMPAVSIAEDINARIVWHDLARLTTPVSGVVASINVDVGSQVKAGDVLLKLDQVPFNTTVKSAKADVAKHTVIRNEAEKELARNQEMYDATMLSQHDLEVTIINQKTAEADLQRANTALDQANYAQSKSILRAPFNGLIVQRNVSQGDTVVTRLQAEPLYVLAGTEKVIARAVVNEQQLGRAKNTNQLNVTYAGKQYRGDVRITGQQPGSNGFSIDVVFSPDVSAGVVAGETVTISLP